MSGMESVLVTNLRKLLADKRVSPTALGKQIGKSPAIVNKILDGTTKNPRVDTLRAIAKVLSVPLQELTGEDDQPASGSIASGQIGYERLHVRWQAEAGLWREIDIDQSEPEEYLVPIPAGRRPLERFLSRVHGDSMNRAHIYDGDTVVCINWIQLDEPMKDGQIVLVQRSRNGGHMIETTVKVLRVLMDRYELHPRSTNPVHKPIVVMRGDGDSDGQHIEILGLVESVYRPLVVDLD